MQLAGAGWSRLNELRSLLSLLTRSHYVEMVMLGLTTVLTGAAPLLTVCDVNTEHSQVVTPVSVVDILV